MLELTIDSLAELSPWLSFSDFAELEELRLDLRVRGLADPSLLVECLGRLKKLRALDLKANVPLPETVVAAIAECESLTALTIEGRCLRDPQLAQLSRAAGLSGLGELRIRDAQLSLDAYGDLAGSRLRETITVLELAFSSCDRAAIDALLSVPWPQLRKLVAPRLGEIDTEVPIEVMDLEPIPLVPSHPELARAARDLLARPGDAGHVDDLVELLDVFDDEHYGVELARDCEAALATWPGRKLRRRLATDELDDRPFWGLIRDLTLDFDPPNDPAHLNHGAPLPVTSLELVWGDGVLTRPLRLDQRFPALETLRLTRGMGDWTALSRLRLPPTLLVLDLHRWSHELLPKDGWIPGFVDWLPPSVRRLRLNNLLCDYRELQRRFGPRDARGWFCAG